MSYKREDETSYALGATVCLELLKSKPQCAVKIYLSSAAAPDLVSAVKSCATVPIEVSDKKINALSKKENCYVIAEFKKFDDKLDADGSHIVLVNPQNSGNLGNIMRTAAAFGVNNVAIITPAVDRFDPKTVRASMGAAFLVNTEEFPSFSDYLKKYGERDLFPFMLDGATELDNIPPSNKYALIFGNEATGLPQNFKAIGTPVKIAQSPKVDSLNLTTAVAIAAYKFNRVKLHFTAV